MEEETIEQRRQRNIQNNFLKLIELGLQPIVKENDAKPVKDLVNTKEGIDIFRDYIDRAEALKKAHAKKYSQRRYQSKQLFGFAMTVGLS